jgi:hypothetical protein
MKTQLTRAVVFAVGLALLVAVAAIAKPKTTARVEKFEAGNIVVVDSGGISPERLPRHEPAPITADLHARMATKDGSHVPAAQQMTIDFDRTLQVDTRGLPVCRRDQLQAQSTAAAKRACPRAILGGGTGSAEVAFPEQAPFSAKGPVVVFNGGTHGRTTVIFFHAYLDVPAPTAIVVETTITKVDDGHYGMHTVTKIPKIAGGAGSMTGVDLKLGRKYTYKGERKSFLTASCPTGVYFIRGLLEFSDGTDLNITHIFPCTPTR